MKKLSALTHRRKSSPLNSNMQSSSNHVSWCSLLWNIDQEYAPFWLLCFVEVLCRMVIASASLLLRFQASLCRCTLRYIPAVCTWLGRGHPLWRVISFPFHTFLYFFFNHGRNNSLPGGLVQVKSVAFSGPPSLSLSPLLPSLLNKENAFFCYWGISDRPCTVCSYRTVHSRCRTYS